MVIQQAQLLKLRSVYLLTEKEKQYIKRWYPAKSSLQIARMLNRSEGAILCHASKMGLYKVRRLTYKPKEWSHEEDRKLLELRKQGIICKKIAQLFGRTPSAIANRLISIKAQKKRRKG